MAFILYIEIVIDKQPMKRILHFLFFCFYSLVPEKNVFGRQNVAMIMMGIVQSYLALILISFIHVFLFQVFVGGFANFIIVVSIIIAVFYLNIKYFEKEGRFETIKLEFKAEKVIYKIIAICIFLLVIFSFAEGLGYLSEVNRIGMK